MNLPNSLSILRAVLLPIILFFMFMAQSKPSVLNRSIADALFIGAAATDFLDGYIARRQRLVSDLGVFLDLTADKALVAGLLISLVALQRVAAWIAIIIVLREFIVTGLRSYAAARGWVIAARAGGKLKTVVTMLALAGLIAEIPQIHAIAIVLLWLATLLTVVSGAQYCLDAAPKLTASAPSGTQR
ncbi:MAG: CDP-diacylglycerol--glycerol-3-phosphate 3-phosphatidyltransferase [Chloroflexi bacterium]|nr:CDP-diacylglycerol--glycerol-3-phosphate 3-phosphatidyltransferase [Chloroflexota bacterium]